MATASAEERALHERLLADDPTVSAEVCERYLTPIVKALRRKFADVAKRDETLIMDAATDALLNYIEAPRKFDPERGRLFSYLIMSAEGDLRNALVRQRRVSEKTVDFVELQQICRNKGIGQASAERGLDSQKIWNRIHQLVPDPTDQAVVQLLLDGVREYDAYAEAMGIMELPAQERRKEVKRVKDRLKARLKRADWTGLIDQVDR